MTEKGIKALKKLLELLVYPGYRFKRFIIKSSIDGYITIDVVLEPIFPLPKGQNIHSYNKRIFNDFYSLDGMIGKYMEYLDEMDPPLTEDEHSKRYDEINDYLEVDCEYGSEDFLILTGYIISRKYRVKGTNKIYTEDIPFLPKGSKYTNTFKFIAITYGKDSNCEYGEIFENYSFLKSKGLKISKSEFYRIIKDN